MENSQKKSGPIVGIIVILLVIILGGYFFTKEKIAPAIEQTSIQKDDDLASIEASLNEINAEESATLEFKIEEVTE